MRTKRQSAPVVLVGQKGEDGVTIRLVHDERAGGLGKPEVFLRMGGKQLEDFASLPPEPCAPPA